MTFREIVFVFFCFFVSTSLTSRRSRRRCIEFDLVNHSSFAWVPKEKKNTSWAWLSMIIQHGEGGMVVARCQSGGHDRRKKKKKYGKVKKKKKRSTLLRVLFFFFIFSNDGAGITLMIVNARSRQVADKRKVEHFKSFFFFLIISLDLWKKKLKKSWSSLRIWFPFIYFFSQCYKIIFFWHILIIF